MDADQFKAYLETLPKDVDALADHIRQKGIKGIKCACTECLITRLFEDDYPGYVFATGGEIHAWHSKMERAAWLSWLGPADRSVSGILVIPTPKFLREFIQTFDEGRLPDLVEE